MIIGLVVMLAWLLPPPEGSGVADTKKPPEDPDVADIANKQVIKGDLAAALAAVIAEPKILDAAWQDPNFPSIGVTMADDGSRRDGFGEYLCMVLAGHNVKGGVVHIFDHAKALREDYVEIGTAWCPK